MDLKLLRVTIKSGFVTCIQENPTVVPHPVLRNLKPEKGDSNQDIVISRLVTRRLQLAASCHYANFLLNAEGSTSTIKCAFDSET
jgi:hypothetical protein